MRLCMVVMHSQDQESDTPDYYWPERSLIICPAPTWWRALYIRASHRLVHTATHRDWHRQQRMCSDAAASLALLFRVELCIILKVLASTVMRTTDSYTFQTGCGLPSTSCRLVFALSLVLLSLPPIIAGDSAPMRRVGLL